MSELVSRLPEYRHWINMKTRCENPNTPFYGKYGGRGITICPRWRDSFLAFFEDMGPRPTKRHSIDRIDNSGNYEPSNCRWATHKEQLRNTRANRIVEFNGQAMTLAEAVDASKLKYNTVLYRLKRGWPLEAAISTSRQRGVKYAAS